MDLAADSALMQAAGRGDRGAFAALVERYQTSVLRFAHGLLGPAARAVAEDLAQETFLAAWEAAPQFRGDAQVSTWLLRIAANVCLDHCRRSRRRRAASLEQEPMPDARAAEQDRPDGQALADERAAEVRAAIARLPPSQRAALVLRHFEGLSYVEIADVLETSVSAVEALLFRARRSLAATLAPDSTGPPQVSSAPDV